MTQAREIICFIDKKLCLKDECGLFGIHHKKCGYRGDKSLHIIIKI